MTRLTDLKVGEQAKIVGYDTTHKELKQKLLAMGLIKKTKLGIVRTAPLGDPVEITVRDFQLSLRKAEAMALLVERLGNEEV